MSDAVSQHGFTAARRGYAPEQVDRALAALTAERDHAWEQLSVLGTGLREMEKRLDEVTRAAADAPDPDFALLSEQAVKLMGIAQAEAVAVRELAERAAEDARDDAYEAGQAAAAQAKEFAATTRGTPTRPPAGPTSGPGPRPSRSARPPTGRPGAPGTARPPRRPRSGSPRPRPRSRPRTSSPSCAAGPTRASPPRRPRRTPRTPRSPRPPSSRLKEAEQHRESVLAQIKQADAQANAKAEELIAGARREAEKIHAESERGQREWAAEMEQVQQHLDHIKQTLAALTGAVVGQIEKPPVAPEPEPESGWRPRPQHRRTRPGTGPPRCPPPCSR